MGMTAVVTVRDAPAESMQWEWDLLAFLRRELAPSPARWRATLRDHASPSSYRWCSSWRSHVPEGEFLLVALFVLAPPDAGASLEKARLRVAGTLVGGAAGLLLLPPGRRRALALRGAPGGGHRRRHVFRPHHDGALCLHPGRRHLRDRPAAGSHATSGATSRSSSGGPHSPRSAWRSPAARSSCSGRTIPRSFCWTTWRLARATPHACWPHARGRAAEARAAGGRSDHRCRRHPPARSAAQRRDQEPLACGSAIRSRSPCW